MKKVKVSLDFEKSIWKNYDKVLGIDEAGRGAIAGPLAISGVIMPKNFLNNLIQDSKSLSKKQREEAYKIIIENSLFTMTVFKSPESIDILNPSKATNEAILEIINNLNDKNIYCLIDGKEHKKFIFSNPYQFLIKGDSKSINIAASSIVSKFTRDRLMKYKHEMNPVYNWDKNKGYPNKKHIDILISKGINKEHRKSYKPIKSLIKKKK